MADAEHDDLEVHLPPIVLRVHASLREGKFVFTFPDNQELTYTPEQCDPIYTTLYQHYSDAWQRYGFPPLRRGSRAAARRTSRTP